MKFTTTIAACLMLVSTTAWSNSEIRKPRKAKKNNRTEQTTPTPIVETAPETIEIPSLPTLPEAEPESAIPQPQVTEAQTWVEDIAMQPYDSLLVIWREQSVYNAFDNYFNDFINIDSTVYLASDVPDSVYMARMKMMVSPIPMPFNDVVKRHIVAYTTSRKTTMAYILGRSQYYFPMIEAELDRQGLPLELRMLPAIESALSPTAKSRMGATGLWQFMYGTGKTYGLEITTFVDMRSDPLASTQAACKYLSYLHGIYGDWLLALAAYNCGPGNVNKAIKRAGDGTKSFWDLYPYLPRETRNYVPSFIAATYAYNYHKLHNIEPAECPFPLATDTLTVDRLLHFEQISSTLDTPLEVIRILNPQYKQDIIPAVGGKTYTLTLPMSDVCRYIEQQDAIHAKDTVYLAQYLKPSNINNTKQFSIESIYYKVKSGDTLSGIASRNGVTVKQLMKWNNLKSADKLRVGQRLEIFI